MASAPQLARVIVCRSYAGRRCTIEEPELKPTTAGHKVACFLMDGATDYDGTGSLTADTVT